MDKFRRVAVAAHLGKVIDNLENGLHFNVCGADDLAKALKISLPFKLDPIHCVKYGDMPEDFRTEIAEELDLHFGDALRKCGIQFFTSPPSGEVARYTLEKL